MKVWVLIYRDDYPFAVFDSEEAATTRALELGRATAETSPDYPNRWMPIDERSEWFAPAVCDLVLNEPGDPQ